MTGIAGPGGGSAEKPVGLVHFGCRRPDGSIVHVERRFGDLGRDGVRMAAVEEAAQCFDTFNIDLMYALPGQSLADWQADLERALSFQPAHLSLYHLTIEPNTAFAKFPPQGLPDEDAAFDMLDFATHRTQAAGLGRYLCLEP